MSLILTVNYSGKSGNESQKVNALTIIVSDVI